MSTSEKRAMDPQMKLTEFLQLTQNNGRATVVFKKMRYKL